MLNTSNFQQATTGFLPRRSWIWSSSHDKVSIRKAVTSLKNRSSVMSMLLWMRWKRKRNQQLGEFAQFSWGRDWLGMKCFSPSGGKFGGYFLVRCAVWMEKCSLQLGSSRVNQLWISRIFRKNGTRCLALNKSSWIRWSQPSKTLKLTASWYHWCFGRGKAGCLFWVENRPIFRGLCC